MDSVGRPVDGGATDHQEIQRRYDVENPDDVNYALQQRRDDGQQGNGENLDPNDKANKYIHLTNYSINKKSDKFVQNTNADCGDEGHKWSLTALTKYLE